MEEPKKSHIRIFLEIFQIFQEENITRTDSKPIGLTAAVLKLTQQQV